MNDFLPILFFVGSGIFFVGALRVNARPRLSMSRLRALAILSILAGSAEAARTLYALLGGRTSGTVLMLLGALNLIFAGLTFLHARARARGDA